ncbi:MAG: hypothetical protein HUU50_22945 [Candidatus Brocadiae bacterium]|nr:hypothetical protein [Candidatus Brocadiia bacterium]
MNHSIEIGQHKIELEEKEPFVYHGSIDALQFVCRRWNWGQKNLAQDMAIRYHKPSQKYYTDTISYNENMLRSTIVSLVCDGKKLEMDALDARKGDFLLDVCLWVNQQKSPELAQSLVKTPQDSLFVVENASLSAEFRPWTWGAKMNSVKSSSVYNPEAQDMQLLNGRFSELLLLNTLKRLRIQGQEISISLQSIQNLPGDIADALVEFSVEINLVPETQKKT